MPERDEKIFKIRLMRVVFEIRIWVFFVDLENCGIIIKY